MFKRITSLLILLSFVVVPAIASPLCLLGAGKSGASAVLAPTTASQFTAANSESLSISDNPSLSFAAEDYSVCAWVYYDSFNAGFNGILGKYTSDAGSKEFFLAHRRNTNVWEFGDYRAGSNINGQVTVSQTASTGTWYFICAGHDTVTSQLWLSVNGAARTNLADSGDIINNNAEFTIGTVARTQATYDHDGRICKSGIWRKTLSAGEITQLYNSGNGLAYCQLDSGLLTSLEGYWDLDESSGTRADSTANANNLTDNNTVTGNPGVGSGNCL